MLPGSTKQRLRGLADAEIRRAKATLHGTVRRVILTLLAAVLVIVAVIILSFAVFFDMSREHGYLVAGFAVSGGLLVLALVILLIAQVFSNRRARIAAEAQVRIARAELAAEAQKAVLLAGTVAPGKGADRKAVLAALIAGLIIGLR